VAEEARGVEEAAGEILMSTKRAFDGGHSDGCGCGGRLVSVKGRGYWRGRGYDVCGQLDAGRFIGSASRQVARGQVSVTGRILT